MSDSAFGFVDGTRLLIGLQQVNAIAKNLSGCLDPAQIARHVTDGLVEKFGCAFARIWLVEPDRTLLKLVASSGLYTRIDGSFARVPMGAFKVGKIAQNQISFLSNQLADEPWVKDRGWAIAHGIQGFAGYPLVSHQQAIGVLAVFSQQPMGTEFLEVLQSLCAMTTIALETALHYQQQKQAWEADLMGKSVAQPTPDPLSEQLAQTLKTTQLTLVGTERSLSVALMTLFLGVAERLSQFHCLYSRLTYATEQIALEVMVTNQTVLNPSVLAEVQLAAISLGATLQIQEDVHPGILQVILTAPYAHLLSHPTQVAAEPVLLSEREREIMTLLTQGLRDRDIASRLIISESTVKFHMNNVLTKLKARTRFQALYYAISKGWID